MDSIEILCCTISPTLEGFSLKRVEKDHNPTSPTLESYSMKILEKDHISLVLPTLESCSSKRLGKDHASPGLEWKWEAIGRGNCSLDK